MSRQSQIAQKTKQTLTPSATLARSDPLQRHAMNQAKPITPPPIVHEVLRSPGQPLDADTRPFMESRFDHDFSRVPVHTAAPLMIQPKLTIGQPNDKYEQEADRMAEQVTRMPNPAIQLKPT